MKRWLAIWVTWLLLSPAAARPQVQQLPDSTFQPNVPKPAFVKRHPRVLFDEAHHNFHTLDGRYRAFAALLRADGYVLTPNREAFSSATLRSYDVLVIANALGGQPGPGADSAIFHSAFRPDEIEAVHEWVSRGGSLLLIADHTPFGSAASALSERFGVDMSKGFAGDSLQAARPGDISTVRFTRAGHTLGDHPILNGLDKADRVDTVVAFTGQSLRGPKGSTPLLILSDAAIDIPPEALALHDDPDAMMKRAVSAKGRCMAVALEARRGRVVVQAEAAMLSAQIIVRPDQEPFKFGMNQPGLDNQQYALNLVRWLARAKPAH